MSLRRSGRKSSRIEDFIESDPIDAFSVKEVSKSVGLGLFAERNFTLGEFLIIYRGKRLKTAPTLDNQYIFAIPSTKEFIDASDENAGLAKFMNDDFEHPNARPYEIIHDSIAYIGFKAKRDISKGEEIRYDYLCGEGNETSFPWRCKKATTVVLEKEVQCDLEQYFFKTQLGGNSNTSKSTCGLRNTLTQVRSVDLNSKYSQAGNMGAESFATKIATVINCEKSVGSTHTVGIQTYTIESSSKNLQCDLERKQGENSILRVNFSVEEQNNNTRDVSAEVMEETSEDEEILSEGEFNSKPSGSLHINDVARPSKEEKDSEIKSECTTKTYASEVFSNDDNSFQPYRCFYCEEDCMDESEVVTHYLGQQCEKKRFEFLDKMDIKATICILCKTFFLGNNVSDIRRHMKSIHQEKPVVVMTNQGGNYQSIEFDYNIIKNVIQDLKRLKTSSRGNDDGPQRKVPYKLICHFCKLELKTHMCLPKHLKAKHNFNSGSKLNAVVKLHYFQTKNAKSKKMMYICTKENCYSVFHRRDKHSFPEHKRFIKPISKVRDLPSNFLSPGETEDPNVSALDAELKTFSRNFDFRKAIDEWVEEKRVDFDDGKGARRYAMERISNLVKKIKLFIVVTEGFASAHAVSVYFAKLKSEQKVKAGQTKSQICRELKDFVIFCRLAQPSAMNDFAQMCDQIERALNRFQQNVNSELPFRKATAKEINSIQVASQEQIICVYKTVVNYLYELLDCFETETYTNKERQYRHLQFCLIFILCARNVCRVSSALYIRKEYFANIKRVKNNLFVFKLINEKVLRNRINGSSGIRTVIDEMTNELRNTNKNFKTEGVRRVVLSENELFSFIRFFRIKQLLGVAHQTFLFQELDQTGDDAVRRNIMGKWNKYLERHLKLEVPINTNAWRKSICTIFAQKLEDIQVERSLDRHIGHSRNVARVHYEMIQKEMDACETSNAVDRVIKISTDTNDEIKIIDASTEEMKEDDSSDVDSNDDDDDTSEVDDESSGDSSEDEYMKPPKKKKQAPLKVNLPLGSSLQIEDGVPSESLVNSFLRSRPQRQNFKKETYSIIANEFVRREKGLGKTTIAQLTKDVNKNQPMKYGTVQFVMNTIYEWKNAGYPSSW